MDGASARGLGYAEEGEADGQVGLWSEKAAPVPHCATPSVRLSSSAGGGDTEMEDAGCAGAPRCPGSIHPIPGMGPTSGATVQWGLLSLVPWEWPMAAARQVD